MGQFQNSSETIVEALLVFLGVTSESPGYRPAGIGIDRVKSKYSSNWRSLESDIQEVFTVVEAAKIDWQMPLPWPPEIAESIDHRIKIVLPWLCDSARKSVAAYFSYQYR